jgi:hypothetical protein
LRLLIGGTVVGQIPNRTRNGLSDMGNGTWISTTSVDPMGATLGSGLGRANAE